MKVYIHVKGGEARVHYPPSARGDGDSSTGPSAGREDGWYVGTAKWNDGYYTHAFGKRVAAASEAKRLREMKSVASAYFADRIDESFWEEDAESCESMAISIPGMSLSLDPATEPRTYLITVERAGHKTTLGPFPTFEAVEVYQDIEAAYKVVRAADIAARQAVEAAGRLVAAKRSAR